MLLGEAAMEKLKSSHVAVFGLGGVGSWCAEALARSGVGRLTLVDRDTVSRSNINRQLCALESTVGLGKAEVVKARLLDINPELEVTALCGHYDAEHRDDFFADYDFIVDCIDLVSCKVDLIRTAKERGIPIVSALGTGNKCDAQRLVLCDIKKTSTCRLASAVSCAASALSSLTSCSRPRSPCRPSSLKHPLPAAAVSRARSCGCPQARGCCCVSMSS